jgi:hypothetical protein
VEKWIIERLSSSQARIDQGPNKALAGQIADEKDRAKVECLVRLLDHSDRHVVHDVILVLAQLAELDSSLVEDYLPAFIPILSSSVNSHIWGCMILISRVTRGNEAFVFNHLAEILEGMAKSTVVARDHGMRIMVELYRHPQFREDVFVLYREQLQIAPDNQLGQYAMRILEYLESSHRPEIIRVLEERQQDLTHDSHRRRIAKILQQYYKQK